MDDAQRVVQGTGLVVPDVEAWEYDNPEHPWTEEDAVRAVEDGEDALITLGASRAYIATAPFSEKVREEQLDRCTVDEVFWTDYLMSLPSFQSVRDRITFLKVHHALAVQIVTARRAAAAAAAKASKRLVTAAKRDEKHLAEMLDNARAWLVRYQAPDGPDEVSIERDEDNR